VKRFGNNIQEVRLSTTLQTGIETISIPGLIPEVYERNACSAANYQFETSWQALSEWERALHIAHYILNNLIKNHVEDAQAREMKKKHK
jgi:hypothetical protein